MAKSAASVTLNPKIEPESIKQKLKLCKERAKKARPGAFTLRPCLSEADVSRIEKRLGNNLPDDYRFFVRKVGNFGTGPCDPLPYLIDHLEVPNDHLSEPFPHSKAWNMPKTHFDGRPEIDEDNEDESWEKYWEYESRHFDIKHLRGAIPVADEGCARWLWLVVTGPERDTLWLDSRTDDRGILPIRLILDAPTRRLERWYTGDRSRGRSKRVAFAVFFNLWLDRQLKRLRIKWPP